MRKYIVGACAVTLPWSGSGYCQDSSETALGDAPLAVVQDPSLATSRIFPPSLGTAAVAAVGPSSRPRPVVNCSDVNPCAMATPARDGVVVTQSKL